jgi:hypothetical protein
MGNFVCIYKIVVLFKFILFLEYIVSVIVHIHANYYLVRICFISILPSITQLTTFIIYLYLLNFILFLLINAELNLLS